MENKLNNVSVVLPSLDPDEKLITVVDGLISVGFSDIILVNDGSHPENLKYFERAATHPEVTLLNHEVNRGKGAALKTAFRFFLNNRPNGLGIVTVDGDNQHHQEDTKACSLRMLETQGVVLGVRDFNLPHVPKRSRFGNHTTSLVFKLTCGLTISDTQTGLRAIPRSAVEVFVNTEGDRFDYETKMLLDIKDHHIPLEEMKIRTVYIEENKSSHFRVFSDSYKIYKIILKHVFRFSLSSFISFLFEYLLSTALLTVYGDNLTGFKLVTEVFLPAGLISSVLNLILNNTVVFQNKESKSQTILKYYALCIPMLLLRLYFIDAFGDWLGDVNKYINLLYSAFIQIVLFVLSYRVQKEWVFASKKATHRTI